MDIVLTRHKLHHLPVGGVEQERRRPWDTIRFIPAEIGHVPQWEQAPRISAEVHPHPQFLRDRGVNREIDRACYRAGEWEDSRTGDRAGEGLDYRPGDAP
ncbi:MAG: hypothetical protein R6X14_01840, partial [bacterium]